jgi:hypothetical protein
VFSDFQVLAIQGMTSSAPSKKYRHSGEGENPGRLSSWIPAFAGMTGFNAACLFDAVLCDLTTVDLLSFPPRGGKWPAGR